METAGLHTDRQSVLQRTAVFSNPESNLVLPAISDQVLEMSLLSSMTKQTYLLCNSGSFAQNPAKSQKKFFANSLEIQTKNSKNMTCDITC